MRIIAGTAGGRRIVAPQGDATRPTSEQIRGAVFNILGAEAQGASVLDLFGGTGALGLEAMSRGAEHCVITDSSRQAFDAIRKNAEAVLGKDFSETCTLLKGDFRQSLKKLAGRKFSLVFLDPDEWKGCGLRWARLRFTTESPEACVALLREYRKEKPAFHGEFTRGLFYRGVE